MSKMKSKVKDQKYLKLDKSENTLKFVRGS